MPDDHSVFGASTAEMDLIEALMNAGWHIDRATTRLYTEGQVSYAILTIAGTQVLIQSHPGGFVVAGYYKGNKLCAISGLGLNMSPQAYLDFVQPHRRQ